MACKICTKLLESVARGDYTSWDSKGSKIRYYQYTHGSGADITTAASEGCRGCAFFDKHIRRNNWDISGTFVTEAGPTDPELLHFYPRRSSGMSVCYELTRVSSQRDRPLSDDHIVNKNASLPFQLPVQASSYPAVETAKAWIKQCEYKHKKCGRTKDPTLPTRVIDVGSASGDSVPKLLETNGLRGRYLTLSYVWGETPQTTTDSNNIQEHKQSLNLQALSRTLRDAIVFTRLLGFQYIWIDALCILQDDVEDWRREAAAMSSIFNNCVLSLCALDAKGSNDGFLLPRDVEPSMLSVDCVELGIREPPRRPRRTIQDGILNQRAWVLQERLLAPASLYFGNDQMYWECCWLTLSEAQPWLHDATKLSKVTDHCNLRCHLREISFIDSLSLWYYLVRSYSRQQLTYENDRLPAIQGLATRFKTLTKSDYWAGLWSTDMHIGLLWYSLGILPNSCILNRVKDTPSWSWASMGDIGVDFPHLVWTIPRIKIWLDRDWRKNKGHLEQHSSQPLALRVEGLYCEVFRSPKFEKGTERNSRSEYGDHDANTNLYFKDDPILCRSDVVTGLMKTGQSTERKYFCLLVAEERDQGRMHPEYHYLVLQRAEAIDVDSAGIEVFRRVGTASEAYWNRYRAENHILDGIVARPILII